MAPSVTILNSLHCSKNMQLRMRIAGTSISMDLNKGGITLTVRYTSLPAAISATVGAMHATPITLSPGVRHSGFRLPVIQDATEHHTVTGRDKPTAVFVSRVTNATLHQELLQIRLSLCADTRYLFVLNQ